MEDCIPCIENDLISPLKKLIKFYLKERNIEKAAAASRLLEELKKEELIDD